MPKGPPVQDIFKQPMPGRDSTPFEFDKKESKQQAQLGTKKTFAPLPPMKKFGGYKPKILAGGSDLISISNGHNQNTEVPAQSRHQPPVLTKPKPFIIGDKNVPMILSAVDDGDSDGYNDRNKIESSMEDMHIYEEPNLKQYINNVEVNNNDMNNVNNNVHHPKVLNGSGDWFNNDEDDHFNHTQLSQNNEAFIIPDDQDSLIGINGTKRDPTAFATENPVFEHTDTDDSRVELEPELDSDLEGVFIPLPDYDEKERTMDFADEDPDDLFDDQQQRQKQLQQQQQHQLQQRRQSGLSLTLYEGEDLSKYLSDDDDDVASFTETVNPRPANARLQPKYSLFKTKPHNTTGKRKSYNKNKSPAFNSVRNFSFADSKYGTCGKSGGKKVSSSVNNKNNNTANDHESFLHTNQQGDGGYETFLRSKHGVGEDVPGDLPYPQWNGKQREGNVWKKLTVRFRHKLQGNGYNMKDH